MATFYITAGLTAQDDAATQPTVTTFYITAGLPANDYAAGGQSIVPLLGDTLDGGCSSMRGL